MGCLLCRAENGFHHRYTKGEFRIQRCASCGLTQLRPPPDPLRLEALYDDLYFSNDRESTGYDDYADEEAGYLATFEADLRRIHAFMPAGRVLDVGCGFGYFVRKALEAGYDAYGIDLAAPAIQTASRHLPGRVFLGKLGEIPAIDRAPFDVIFASHLIEHILDPLAFVSQLTERLTDAGILVFVTPNIQSWLSRVSGPRWVSYKIPEHVAYYDPSTIEELLRRCGLHTLAIDSAYQTCRVPFVARRVRRLIHPVGRLVPPFERLGFFKHRMLRVTSGSLRAIARKNRS